MKGNIKAVIFDWGGVVAPIKNVGWVNQLAELLNVDFNEALDLWRECSPGFSSNKITEDDFWQLITEKTGINLPNDRSKIWSMGVSMEPYAEITEIVRKLKREGIVVVILSNTIEPMEGACELDEMYKDFDYAFLSHQMGVAKPDRAIFIHAIKKLKLLPQECILIDDAPKNIQVAKKLGFKTILSDHNPQHTISELNKIL